MTEFLRARIQAVYNDLHFVVERDARADIGAPTVRAIRDLITEAKDTGASPDKCDKLLDSFPLVSRGTKVPASDALVIAGQLRRIVGS